MAPLAGRPPFATDIPDSVYAQSQPQARYRQPPRDNPNSRTSAYNHYDAYLNGGHDNSNGTYTSRAALATVAKPGPSQLPIPLVAPKPGYAAPIDVLQSQSSDTSHFPPGIGPAGRMMQPNQHSAPRMPPPAVRHPHPPSAPVAVPSTPHPLPPTMTPILPVFARPARVNESRDVKWGPEPIMRGNSEEKLLPRRGEQGDDFWRRFSMVAREGSRKPKSQKESAWLRETRSGANRMSVWIWIIGLILFSCAGLGIGVGWYFSHRAPSHQDPTAIGGGANSGANITSLQSNDPTPTSTANSLTSPHVTPTNTVNRRAAFPYPLPTPTPGAPILIKHVSHSHGSKHGSAHSHRQRRHLEYIIV